MIQADPVLMGREMIRAAVAEWFVDEGKSVREAAVQLVGNFVVQGENSSQLVGQYFRPLASCLNDEGVSVRKSVVRTLKSWLIAHPHHQQQAEISCALIQRAGAVQVSDVHSCPYMVYHSRGS